MIVFIVIRKHVIPLQSNVFTFESKQPYIQDPLKASQCRSLQSVEHKLPHPEENLLSSHPETNSQLRETRQVLCACNLIFFYKNCWPTHYFNFTYFHVCIVLVNRACWLVSLWSVVCEHNLTSKSVNSYI